MGSELTGPELEAGGQDFISELSLYARLYDRVFAFEPLPDAEQLNYAFSETELRLLLRWNEILTVEHARQPGPGANYVHVEKGKPQLVAALLPALHRLRPAGELRRRVKSGAVQVCLSVMPAYMYSTSAH